MLRRALLLTAFLLLAGCAEQATPDMAAAAKLLANASGDLPTRYGVDMSVTRDATPLLSMKGSFDSAHKTAYLEVELDPSLAASATMLSGTEGGPDAEAFRRITLHQSPEGNAFLANGTILFAPASEAEGPMSPAAIAAAADPKALLERIADDATLTRVEATTHRGKPALRIEGVTKEDPPAPFTAYVFTEPARIARLEMPANADAPQLAGARVAMDLLYDEEVTLAASPEMTRALGLRFESSGHLGGETWTFKSANGPPLDEVEVRISQTPGGEPIWSMRLSEGTRREGNLSVTFTDADASRSVSAGDTLRIDGADGRSPSSLTLIDLKTGIRVVPGGGLALLVVGALGAVVAIRAQKK